MRSKLEELMKEAGVTREEVDAGMTIAEFAGRLEDVRREAAAHVALDERIGRLFGDDNYCDDCDQ